MCIDLKRDECDFDPRLFTSRVTSRGSGRVGAGRVGSEQAGSGWSGPGQGDPNRPVKFEKLRA